MEIRSKRVYLTAHFVFHESSFPILSISSSYIARSMAETAMALLLIFITLPDTKTPHNVLSPSTPTSSSLKPM